MSQSAQKGFAPLLLIAGMALVIFLLIAASAPLRNGLLLSFFPKQLTQAANGPLDVTAQIENLGNAAKVKYPDSNVPCIYARNVWDLQAFNGKIYIGSGNSANAAPCPNAGPVYIMAYNPVSNSFATESTINEEQIDRFVTIDGSLIIPGHDPKGTDYLEWYRWEGNGWVLHQFTGANAIHTYDMIKFGTDWFSANGNGSGTSQFNRSTDNGATWTPANTLGDLNRGRGLFILNGTLYGVTEWSTTFAFGSRDQGLWKYNGTSFTLLPHGKPQMFPSTATLPANAIVPRVVTFGSNAVYIGAQDYNDHQFIPFGLYKMDTSEVASLLSLPSGAMPWDLMVGANNKLYVLGAIKNGSRYWITVSSTTDLTNWTEEFRFDSSTYAASFELLNGDFYFGLGTDTTTLALATGDLLRVKASALVPPASPIISSPVSPSPAPSLTPSITPPPAKVGDIDGNGRVDIFDYNQLLTDFGKQQVGLVSDIDGNGVVNIFDYNLLLTNLGT